MPKAVDKATGEVAEATTSAAIMDAFTDLVMSVPEAADDDGSGILARILDAENLTDLMDDGELPSSKDLVGQRLRVDSIKRRVSDKGGSLGWYLICEGSNLTAKKPLTFSAGGSEAVAKLSQAHKLGILPVLCEFVSVSTRSGNDAINCKITAGGGGAPRTVDA